MAPKTEIGPIVKVTKKDDEWKRILTAEQYQILRHEGTEPAFYNALHDNKTAGIYHCVPNWGCSSARQSASLARKKPGVQIPSPPLHWSS